MDRRSRCGAPAPAALVAGRRTLAAARQPVTSATDGARGSPGAPAVIAVLLHLAAGLGHRRPRALDAGRRRPAACGCSVVCAAVAGSIALVLRRIAVPVADIIAAANRIAAATSARGAIPEHGPRWVRDVSRAFNAMATELDAQDQARRHLMADIAHELRTPLTIVQGKLEGLIDGVYPRDDERLQGLLEDTRMLTRLVDDLRTLSTAESGALGLAKEPTESSLWSTTSSRRSNRRHGRPVWRMEVQAGAERTARPCPWTRCAFAKCWSICWSTRCTTRRPRSRDDRYQGDRR